MLENNLMEHVEKNIAMLEKEHGNNKYMMGNLNAYQGFKTELEWIIEKIEAIAESYKDKADEYEKEGGDRADIKTFDDKADAIEEVLQLLERPQSQ